MFGILVGKKRKQTGRAIPLGLLASIRAPILGELAKQILGKFLVVDVNVDVEGEEDKRKNSFKAMDNCKSRHLTKRYNVYCQI